MAWERRGRKRFFYLKTRNGTKVRSSYFGREVDAHLVAADVAHEAYRRAQARESARIWRAAEQIMERLMAGLEQDIRTLTGATLLALGFRTHRGQWRMRRDANEEG